MTIRSLYLHYPFCRHLCNYCDFYKKVPTDESSLGTYEALLDQMSQKHLVFLEDKGLNLKNLDTLFIGGGTPSLWGERGANHLRKTLQLYSSNFTNEHEATLEVNPGSWSEKGLKAFQEVGINRFSLGIQSLQKEMIKVLDRVHSLEDVYETLNYFSKESLNFSVDFMLGLPFSEYYKRDIIAELENILSFKPEHISLYILTTKSNYIHKKHLPSEDYIAKEYLDVASYLQEHGFEHYEVSNFAKKNRKSKHNLAYWRSESVAALGPSATGYLKEHSLRYKWKVKSAEFTKESLNDEQVKIESLYMKLRVSDGLKIEDYFDARFFHIAKELFQELIEQRKMTVRDDVYKLTSKGYLVLDSIVGQLLGIV